MIKLLYKIGLDGMAHILCSTVLVAIFATFLPVFIACIIVLAIGIMKELLWDFGMKKGSPQVKDFLCDISGIVLALGILLIGDKLMFYV